MLADAAAVEAAPGDAMEHLLSRRPPDVTPSSTMAPSRRPPVRSRRSAGVVDPGLVPPAVAAVVHVEALAGRAARALPGLVQHAAALNRGYAVGAGDRCRRGRSLASRRARSRTGGARRRSQPAPWADTGRASRPRASSARARSGSIGARSSGRSSIHAVVSFGFGGELLQAAAGRRREHRSEACHSSPRISAAAPSTACRIFT